MIYGREFSETADDALRWQRRMEQTQGVPRVSEVMSTTLTHLMMRESCRNIFWQKTLLIASNVPVSIKYIIESFNIQKTELNPDQLFPSLNFDNLGN